MKFNNFFNKVYDKQTQMKKKIDYKKEAWN